MPILFIIFLFFIFQAPVGAVEIYSAGRHFSSMEEYRKIDQKPELLPLNAVEAIPQTKPVMPVLDVGLQKMDRISYDHAVSKVVIGFDQSWKNPKPKFVLEAKDLEHAIKEVMKNQHEPTMLISDSKKLRIMTYHAKEGKISEEIPMYLDKTAKK